MCLPPSPDTYLCCLEGELTLVLWHIPIISAFKDLESHPLSLCLPDRPLPADPHFLPLLGKVTMKTGLPV